jgi:hypothetical protein
MKQLGHNAAFESLVEGVLFRRCTCGLALAFFPSGALYHLRVRGLPRGLETFDDLLATLAMNCPFGRERQPAPTARPSPPPLPPTLAALQEQVRLKTKGKPVVVTKRKLPGRKESTSA